MPQKGDSSSVEASMVQDGYENTDDLIVSDIHSYEEWILNQWCFVYE